MEIRLNPYDAVEEGRGDDVKVDETGVSDGAHAFTINIRRTSLRNDATFFKILSPLDST